MDTPFIYNECVTGRNFIGRTTERNILANLIKAGEHISLYEPPKTGKMSLLMQVFNDLQNQRAQIRVAMVDMLNVRSLNDFAIKFGTELLRTAGTTQEEYASLMETYLGGTHFVFDKALYATKDDIVSLNWELDANDIAKLMELPDALAQAKGVRYVVVLKEFQNLMNAPEYEMVFKIMETQMKNRDRKAQYPAVYVMMGGMVNAMKLIFEEKRYFYRQVNHLALSKVDNKEIVEYIVKGFLSGMGKAFDRNMAMEVCELFQSNLWYINHLAAVCDALTKGFVTEAMKNDAVNSMLSLHEIRFASIINDLTDHQLSLLRAVLDGVVKFSSSEVIERYRLNSSANVRRVKDALKKKEVITFNEKDEPLVMDPLFEYWLRKIYFQMSK